MSELEKRLAVFLSDSGARPVNDGDWTSCDVNGLVARLRRNKVPLLYAQRLRPTLGIWAEPVFQQVIMDERSALDRQRAEFAPVHGALASAGIPTALIKSAGIAPSFPYRSDNMDVMVPSDAELQAAEAIYGLGYVELRNVEEPRKFLFKRFVGGEEVSAIHLHTQVGWGTGFLVDERLWERVRLSEDDPLVAILGSEDELLVTLAHAFYEDKEFKIWELVKARHCVGADGFDWDYCARQAEERGWLHGLNASLDCVARMERKWWDAPRLPARVPGREQAWAGWEAQYGSRLASGADALPSRVPFVYSKRHYFSKVAADRRLSAAEKWDDALRHALAGVRRNLGLFSQNGMLIALSGVDGSGKTVHAEALKAALDRCDIRARIVWSRGASSPLTDALIRTGKSLGVGTKHRPEGGSSRATTRLTDGPPSKDVADARIQRRAALWRRPVVRRLWPWALALDLWRLYIARVTWPLLRGKVVIADRYVADAQAEVAAYLEEAGEGSVPFALRLLERVSPKPALRFLLDVPPSVAVQRKGGQESEGFLEAQIAQYRRLAGGTGWHTLDTTRPQEAISSEVVRVSLLHYYRRYHTFVNSLFLFNPRAKRPFLREE
jgi:thymidylate kinase